MTTRHRALSGLSRTRYSTATTLMPTGVTGMRAAAERERARLEAVGEIDRVWENQGVGADAAPKFDTLMGKSLELRWKYYDEGKPVRARLQQQWPVHTRT